MKPKIPRVSSRFTETANRIRGSIKDIKISEPIGIYIERTGSVRMTPLKVMRLESAIALAANAHRGQVDLAGEPYILHPLRVMGKFKNNEARIAAVLHDVVEDTKWTIEELQRAQVPEVSLRAIRYLTRNKGNETYMNYIERVCHNSLARRIKIEDLLDNLNLERLKLEDIPKYISLIKREKKALSFCLSAEKDNYTGNLL